MTFAWLAHYDIAEPNVCFCTRNTTSSPNHESKSNRAEGGLYLHSDRRGGVGADLTCGQACKDDIMVADTPESVGVSIIILLREVVMMFV